MLLSFAHSSARSLGSGPDKIGLPPEGDVDRRLDPDLGYDVEERKLVVNEHEAETVRLIFRRYSQLKSVHILGHTSRRHRLAVTASRGLRLWRPEIGSLAVPSIHFCRTISIAARSPIRENLSRPARGDRRCRTLATRPGEAVWQLSSAGARCDRGGAQPVCWIDCGR